MKKLLLSILLFSIALILLAILAPFGLLITITKSIYIEVNNRKIGIKNVGVDHASEAMLNNGIVGDIFGNVLLKDLFNLLFVKNVPNAIKFGNTRMTISGVLGLNYEQNTLTWLGVGFGLMLDLLDKDHMAKAAENNRMFVGL